MRPIGLLVDADHGVDVFETGDGIVLADIIFRFMEIIVQGRVENLVDNDDFRHRLHHSCR